MTIDWRWPTEEERLEALRIIARDNVSRMDPPKPNAPKEYSSMYQCPECGAVFLDGRLTNKQRGPCKACDPKEIEVHHDKRQRLLNRLTDKILSVHLENWTWTREEWVVWIKNHRISLPADFAESLKIGIGLGVTTRPDVPIETRNTDRIKALVHALSVRREEIQQEKIEAILKDIEEGSDG